MALVEQNQLGALPICFHHPATLQLKEPGMVKSEVKLDNLKSLPAEGA